MLGQLKHLGFARKKLFYLYICTYSTNIFKRRIIKKYYLIRPEKKYADEICRFF